MTPLLHHRVVKTVQLDTSRAVVLPNVKCVRKGITLLLWRRAFARLALLGRTMPRQTAVALVWTKPRNANPARLENLGCNKPPKTRAFATNARKVFTTPSPGEKPRRRAKLVCPAKPRTRPAEGRRATIAPKGCTNRCLRVPVPVPIARAVFLKISRVERPATFVSRANTNQANKAPPAWIASLACTV